MEKGRSEENWSRGAVRGVVRVLLFVFTLLYGANWKRESESKEVESESKMKQHVWREKTKWCVLILGHRFGEQIRDK